MKTRFFALASLIVMSAIAFAQEVTYYLPKAEVAIEITYEEQTLTQGPFYQYADHFLGAKDIVTESGTRYSIEKVSIKTRSVANTATAYHFDLTKAAQHFVLSKDGVLKGLNIEAEEAKEAPKDKTKTDKPSSEVADVMPLMEEQIMAGSLAKLAEGTAKQIFRIREARMNLLSGEVEAAPADGKSMELVLKEMRKQEKALTALFVGKKESRLRKAVIYVKADELVENKLAFRFSALQGVVDADDMSGEPYYFSLQEVNIPTAPAADPKAPTSGLFYTVPATLHATVTDGLHTLADKNVAIPQLGYVTRLSDAALKGAPKVRLGKEGQLLSIEK